MYKDARVQKEYQKNWYERKKKGLETRTKPVSKKLTKKELQEKRRISNLKCVNKKKDIIRKYLGTKCFFCMYEDRLITHRKDGKEHKKLIQLSLANLEDSLKSNGYVYVCYHCHKGIHWCMKQLGFNWEKIISFRKG